MGCPIRKSADQRLFAPPHSLSQRITSFIACACQGIHQMPLRHLISLIANIHHCPGCASPKHKYRQKRPASRDISRSMRLSRPLSRRILSKSGNIIKRQSFLLSEHIFSSQYQANRQSAKRSAKIFLKPYYKHIKAMVEPDGIEPTTPCLQSRCSPS